MSARSGASFLESRSVKAAEQLSDGRTMSKPTTQPARYLGPGSLLAAELGRVLTPQHSEQRPPLWTGDLAVTRDGRTTYSPQVTGHPRRPQILAHEAVHRAQFSHRGVRPVGDDDALEREAAAGSAEILRGRPFVPVLAAPPSVSLGFPPSTPGSACPGGCHQPTSAPPDPGWRNLTTPGLGSQPKVKTPAEILADQPKTIQEEIGRFEQNIVANRGAVFDRLEEEAAGPAPGGFRDPAALDVRQTVPPDLRRRYGAAAAAAAAARVGIDAKSLTDETQTDARTSLTAFQLAVGELAAAVGKGQAERYERYRAQEEQWNALRGQRPPPCPNCHTATPEPELRPQPPVVSVVPGEVATTMPAKLTRLDAAGTVGDWGLALADLDRSIDHMDRLLNQLLSPWSSLEGSGLQYLKTTKAHLEEFHKKNPLSIPIPAVFYPEDRWVDAEDQPDPNVRVQVKESIPWRFYLSHTGASPDGAADGEWVLLDMTSPREFTETMPATAIDAMLFKFGKWDPPKALFDKLNNKYHFPKGRLHWTSPSGKAESMEMTEPRTMSDWLRIIGMTVGAIALIAGLVLTAGLAAPAVVPALSTIAVTGGLLGAGLNIAATVTEMEEKRKYGLLTSTDVDRALLSIGLDIIGALSLGLGRLAVAAEVGVSAAQTGQKVGAVARALATLNGRYLFAITRSAAVMKRVGLAADLVQVGTATVDFIKAFNAIRSQPNLSDADRESALVKLIASSLLTGTLLTVSLHGGFKDIAGKTVRVSGADSDGLFVSRSGRAQPVPRGAGMEVNTPVSGPKAGWSRQQPRPQVDVDLPEGRVEVRIVRDEAGRIVGAQTYHHPRADPDSVAIHEELGRQLVTDAEELRLLLFEQRKAFGGEQAPIELQLELRKLFAEVAAAEKKLAKGRLSGPEINDVRHRHDLLQEEIANVKKALADPDLHRSYPAGVFGLPVKPTTLPRKLKAGGLEKPPNFPDPPDDHIYYLRENGTWDIRPKAGARLAQTFSLEYHDGKPVATNRANLETKFAGRSLTPARRAQLEQMGYVFQSDGVVRRPMGHAKAGRPQMVPLEVDGNNRIQIAEGTESIAEMQSRLRSGLSKGQSRKLAGVEAKAEPGAKVVLVEGVYDTGFSWGQILTLPKRRELRALLAASKVPDADIDRLIDALVSKAGTVKVVVGTPPVRAAVDYRAGFAKTFGAAGVGVEIHHGDPLYLGGGSDPATLFGLKSQPHDALHAFFDALTLPSGRLANTPLQSSILQAKVKDQLKRAVAVVQPDGTVRYETLGR